MGVSTEDVRRFLDVDEPDYAAAALHLGPDALGPLAELVRSGDTMLASKAVYLAGLIGGPEAQPILEYAAASDEPVLRVSAASAVRNIDEDMAARIGGLLVDDADAGVRKTLLRSMAVNEAGGFGAQVVERFREDVDATVRAIAEQVER